MQKIEIRRARPSDAEAFAAMLGQEGVMPGTLQVPYPSPDKWRERLAPSDTDYILIAEIDGAVVGHGGVHLAAGRRRVHAASIGMSTDEAWHGKGVGSALLEAMVDLAEKWLQISRLELTVFADNQRAIGLYRKFGFKEEGLMRGFAMRDGILIDALMMARLGGRLAPPA
jgi:putative acetyltransferase